jgi:outer membrane biosynthesis protein TonB
MSAMEQLAALAAKAKPKAKRVAKTKKAPEEIALDEPKVVDLPTPKQTPKVVIKKGKVDEPKVEEKEKVAEQKIERKPRKQKDPDAPKKERQKIEAGLIYCVKCKKGVDCKGCTESIKELKSGRKQKVLQGNCPVCSCKVSKFVANN